MTNETTAVLFRARRAHRHLLPITETLEADGSIVRTYRCGHVLNPDAAKRGRTALRAGKDAERSIAKAYGGKRTGMYGGPDDVLVGDLFSIQSKVGWFSERYWNELVKLPRTGGRIPTLIVSEKHGHPGVKPRRLVIRMFSDDLDLHGTMLSGPASEEPTE